MNKSHTTLATYPTSHLVSREVALRKANFDILEGFLGELLSEDIVIKRILENEGEIYLLYSSIAK